MGPALNSPWNMLSALLRILSNQILPGSSNMLRVAFQLELIWDCESRTLMIQDRILIGYTY